MEEILVGLDVGSSRIRCLLATQEDEGGPLKVVAHGESESNGVRAGVIINIRNAAAAIEQAITAVETRGYEVTQVTSGITGMSIEGINSRGVVALVRGAEIKDADIEKVLNAAKAIVIPGDREILHVIPQEYIVDGTPDIHDPRGMMGVRLEAETHIVTVSLTAVRNLINAVNTAGARVDELVFGALAAGEVCLTQDEKRYGCVHVHLGAGTTDVVLWHEGAPRFSRSYPIGGNMVSSDIANVLRVSLEDAERLKREGSCYPGLLENDSVLIQRVGDSRVTAVPVEDLVRIVAARAIETMQIVRGDLIKSGTLDRISGGVVLTGGGSQLLGLPELVQDVFQRPARVGVPMGLSGLRSPYDGTEWTVCCGLVAAAARTRALMGKGTGRRSGERSIRDWFRDIVKRII